MRISSWLSATSVWADPVVLVVSVVRAVTVLPAWTVPEMVGLPGAGTLGSGATAVAVAVMF